MSKREIGVWLDGGDFFDSPAQNCLLINQIIELFKESDVRPEAHFILGNHVVRGNVETSLAKGGLRTLEAAGFITLEEDPYIWTCPETGITVLLWHHSVVPARVPWDHVTFEECAEQYDVDYVLCSHIHTPRKPKTIGKTTFLSPGSLGRGIGNELNPVRQVYAVMLDTVENKAKYVKVPCEENPFKAMAVTDGIYENTERLIAYITESIEDHSVRNTFERFVKQMKADEAVSDVTAEYLLKKYADIRED